MIISDQLFRLGQAELAGIGEFDWFRCGKVDAQSPDPQAVLSET
jgi:hypothetical protein